MSNRIRNVQVSQKRWDAAEAELWITVEPEHITPTTELRGRLVGPRSPGVTTVEVAYPLQPLPRPQAASSQLTMRVVIPEPVAGRREQPYFYEGPVELWEDGQKCDQAPVRVSGRAEASS
jgi:hypothetical protein